MELLHGAVGGHGELTLRLVGGAVGAEHADVVGRTGAGRAAAVASADHVAVDGRSTRGARRTGCTRGTCRSLCALRPLRAGGSLRAGGTGVVQDDRLLTLSALARDPEDAARRPVAGMDHGLVGRDRGVGERAGSCPDAENGADNCDADECTRDHLRPERSFHEHSLARDGRARFAVAARELTRCGARLTKGSAATGDTNPLGRAARVSRQRKALLDEGICGR